jgi:hypothetical protein
MLITQGRLLQRKKAVPMNASSRAMVAVLILPLLAAGALRVDAAANVVQVPVYARNGSGEAGTATLRQQGPDVLVNVHLAHAPAGPQPIHIHGGTCDAPAAVRWPLTNVMHGSSTTVIHGVKLSTLLGHGYVLNVHESTMNMGHYVACGPL